MKIYLQSITGWDDAISSLYISKGNWSPALDKEIHDECDLVFNRRGFLNIIDPEELNAEAKAKYDKCMSRLDVLFKFGKRHITMMRFLDFAFVVDGLHRGAQDDWDAHARRYDNRIIRLSTRIGAMKNCNEDNTDVKLSDFYTDKVLTLGEALKELNIELPETIEKNGKTYVRGINGYVDKDNDTPDVRRGLYPIGLSSSFIFKCNLCEYPHVRSLRRRKTEGFPESGHAHPELWDLVDMIDECLKDNIPFLTEQWLDSVKQ